MNIARSIPVLATRPNRFQLIAFDPGGTIGWAHFSVHFRAFSRPEHRVLRYVESWDCGEFTGTEHEQIKAAIALIHTVRWGPMPFVPKTHVITEDFDLVQTVGGKELVSPLRINAVLDFICLSQFSLTLQYQKRQARIQQTAERLRAFGFHSPFRTDGRWSANGKGKDAFAAVQHAVTWLRRLKAESDRRPWKLESKVSTNAYWDCSCASASSPGSLNRSRKHDLVHPQ